MKLLMLACSVYLLLLGFVPCADAMDASHTPGMEAAAPGHEHQSETCTPLCVCNCCSISLSHFSPQAFVHNAAYHFTAPVELMPGTSALLTGTCNSIWQPPRP